MNSAVDDQSARIRQPAVAGQFYPRDPSELRTTITNLLANVPRADHAPKAIVAPHAGYLYSGPIAATAYAQLLPLRDTITRIVLLGPSHRVEMEGLAAPSATGFATPLGVVPVDTQSIARLQGLPKVKVWDGPHTYEHSLEVQLPFLQVVLNDFTVVPLLAGEIAPNELSPVFELLWGGPETRFVISSDLSHYYESQIARRLDRTTADAIEALDPDRLGEEQACGRVPLRGLLQAAREHHLRARTLDLRNSGDTAGPRHQVVGYGAFGFDEG